MILTQKNRDADPLSSNDKKVSKSSQPFYILSESSIIRINMYFCSTLNETMSNMMQWPQEIVIVVYISEVFTDSIGNNPELF